MTPFVGLQFIIAVFIAKFLKWNKIAAGVAVFNTNVATGAFLFGINYFIGSSLLGVENTFSMTDSEDSLFIVRIFNSGYTVFFSFLLGGLITGIPSAYLAYLLIKRVLRKKFLILRKQNSVDGNIREYALITGASRGLGRAIAIELASQNFHLLLVALKSEGLPELSRHLENEYHVQVDYLEINLAGRKSIQQISSWVGDRNVSILVNNAGVGGSRSFEEADLNYLERIIQINIRSLSLLTWQLLPKLKACSNSFILNVASMASFCPIAYKTIYPASKAFVYNFSLCLKQELRNSNVSVSVLHPGPMPTNADVSLRINRQGKLAKFGVMTPENVARCAIKNLFESKTVIIPGICNKINWLMIKLIPSTVRILLISTFVKRELACNHFVA